MRDEFFDEEERIAAERAADRGRLAAELLQRPIREQLSLRPPITCERQATVRQAITMMQRERTGYVLVIDQGQLAGIFTERDVLTKVVAREVDMDHSRIETLMTPHPDCLSPDDELVYALNQMSIGGYRHIPLIDDQGQPSGVVSMRDIVHYLIEVFPQDVLNLPPTPMHWAPPVREGA